MDREKIEPNVRRAQFAQHLKLAVRDSLHWPQLPAIKREEIDLALSRIAEQLDAPPLPPEEPVAADIYQQLVDVVMRQPRAGALPGYDLQTIRQLLERIAGELGGEHSQGAFGDGWREWPGADKAPVTTWGWAIDIKFRNGDVHDEVGHINYRWTHENAPDDVVAYRLVRPFGKGA